MGINAFSMGICLAKCMTTRDTAMVSKDHRKLHIRCPMVTWLMTSRDPKRSRSWPQNLWSSISQQPCEIHGRFILTTNRKPHIVCPMVTWPITSRDHERSRSWPQYLWTLISQKQCEIDGWLKLTPIGNHTLGFQWAMMSLIANCDSLRLGPGGGLLGNNNGCKILANEG